MISNKTETFYFIAILLCSLVVGYGDNVSFSLSWWQLNSSNEYSFDSVYYLTNAPFTSYGRPTISPHSLRLNGSAVVTDSTGQTFFNLPNAEESYWLTFDGWFGAHTELITITYISDQNNSNVFSCVIDPDQQISPDSILCRTASSEPSGQYRFVVSIDGYESLPSEDILISPEIKVNSITGCRHVINDATSGCHTAGGDSITVRGEGFLLAEGMVCISGDAGSFSYTRLTF